MQPALGCGGDWIPPLVEMQKDAKEYKEDEDDDVSLFPKKSKFQQWDPKITRNSIKRISFFK